MAQQMSVSLQSACLVHVVDGDLLSRSTLARALGAVGIACRVHSSGADALSVLGTASSCIVLRSDLPDMTACDFMAEASLQGHDLPVLVVTEEGDVDAAVAAMKAGAADCIARTFGIPAFLERLRACMATGNPHAEQRDRGRDAIRRLGLLSRRETEVLELIVDGKQSKTIAWELGISIKTVEVHRARIMEKTGSRSIVGLGRLWESAEMLRARELPRPLPLPHAAMMGIAAP
ncbi:response regulator transcription factor [Azospirillum picis]|uniref:FixJ family two-component response regulator n=1 Tax=Azospirillum picis TaxID=488438 RepID=A0ABU0MQI3_9PROT|nr:LuxR C-terminal-related transcriptional regulator [Azospirillum picis]MBP2301692.1 FixJ family two-component response regulator [Azospirillum picis]MDQ0535484.1 FixJ family two-component response regulator [Azospirillum picis]